MKKIPLFIIAPFGMQFKPVPIMSDWLYTMPSSCMPLMENKANCKGLNLQSSLLLSLRLMQITGNGKTDLKEVGLIQSKVDSRMSGGFLMK